MVERFLADVLIAQPDIALERCLKVFGTTEMVAGDDLRQSSVEPLDDAGGLRRARPGEAVLDSQDGTRQSNS